eukprot:gene1657-4108_t
MQGAALPGAAPAEVVSPTVLVEVGSSEQLAEDAPGGPVGGPRLPPLALPPAPAPQQTDDEQFAVPPADTKERVEALRNVLPSIAKGEASTMVFAGCTAITVTLIGLAASRWNYRSTPCARLGAQLASQTGAFVLRAAAGYALALAVIFPERWGARRCAAAVGGAAAIGLVAAVASWGADDL